MGYGIQLCRPVKRPTVIGGGNMPGLSCGPLQCQALSVSACCSSRGFHRFLNPSHPPLSVPTGPSKADFPRRRASRGGLQPGTGGRQGKASEPASEPWKGAGLKPVTELKIVLPWHTGLEVQALTTHTQLENLTCINKHALQDHYILMGCIHCRYGTPESIKD